MSWANFSSLPQRRVPLKRTTRHRHVQAAHSNCACPARAPLPTFLQVQASILRRSPEIVVATPGRLIDHLHNTQSVGLEDLAVLVLDEADRCARPRCCKSREWCGCGPGLALAMCVLGEGRTGAPFKEGWGT